MSAIWDAHKKKVGVERLYNSVHRKFNQLVTRCGRENQHPAEWAPRPLVEQPRRTGKKRGYSNESEGQYVSVLFGLQLPLIVKPLSNPFEPFQIKWEVYFSKELCRSSLLCHRYDSACICVYIVFMAIQQIETIQATTLLRSARILRKVLETRADLLLLTLV